ncbi:MAG: Hsp20/alpha crystallin family protein [Anaerolineaceae bacterium]
MSLYYYSPYPHRMRRHMMERMMNGMGMDRQYGSEIMFPVDVEAKEDTYVITALLPGIKPDEINIQVANDTVSIQGEMKLERDEKASYLLTERPSGKFNRALTLPTTLDPEHIEAHFDNGVLTLSIPKAPEARPRTIKVTVK